MKRVSGPLLDRIDISVEMGSVAWEQLQRKEKAESSAQIRARVEMAYQIQMDRQYKLNSDLTNEEMAKVCIMEDESKQMLRYTFEGKKKSVRGYERVRKVARTIADLAQSDKIAPEHMAQAIVLNSGMEALVDQREGIEA